MSGELVTVATYNTSYEASMAKNCLQAAGVRAILADDITVGMAWHLGNALGGVKLQVQAEDAERAEQILAEVRPETGVETDVAEGGEVDEHEAEGRPEFMPEEPSRPPSNWREENARRAVRCALLGLLLWPLQLYAFWLLMKVLVSEEPLTAESRRLAVIAACINIPFILVCCWVLGLLL